MSILKSMFKGWTKVEFGILALFSVVAIGLSYYWGDTMFGFSVFLTGVICVVMCAKGSIWNYLFGLYNVIGYSYISWGNGLYGEVMLNMLFYLPMQFIGFYMWKNHIADDGVVEAKFLSTKHRIFWVLAIAVAFIGYGTALNFIPSQNTPYIDAFCVVLSVAAQILMAKRFAEQWILWIAVDVFSVIMWSLRLEHGVDGAAAMVVMWAAYLLNACYGWYTWNKEAKSNVAGK